MNNSEKSFDAVIVGGGMVGAAAALGIAKQGLQVALVEHETPARFDPSAPADLRISAVSFACTRFLQKLGAWEAVEKSRLAPFRRLETWEADGSEVKFNAQSLGLPELGFMVENRVLQLALWQQFDALTNLTCFCPARLCNLLQQDDKTWFLQLATGELLRTKLVIAADGANSLVRKLAGIGVYGWEYRQHCMLINVETEMPDQDVTWQQFSPFGPRAFLPLFDNQASLVWYDSPQHIRYLKTLNMQQLTTEVMQVFPTRLGAAKALSAGVFPLVRRHAQRYVLPGLVLVGDAAHTINPLAGQGVNLGYRDVEALLSILKKAQDHDEAWNSEKVLLRYQSQRRLDNLLMQSSIDLLYAAFSNDLALVKALRNLALMTAQHAGVLKNIVLKYALGI